MAFEWRVSRFYKRSDCAYLTSRTDVKEGSRDNSIIAIIIRSPVREYVCVCECVRTLGDGIITVASITKRSHRITRVVHRFLVIRVGRLIYDAYTHITRTGL